MKFKLVATAGLSLTLDPMGKMFQNASSLKPLGQLKPNCPGIIIWRSSKNVFFSEAIALIKPKLCINHWKILYKLRVFYVDRNSKMTTTAGHSFYIGPIGSFYNQVNDTGSCEPLVCVMLCWSLLVLLYLFFWPLCCLFFFDIQILITPLVSSNSFWNVTHNLLMSLVWFCFEDKASLGTHNWTRSYTLHW